VLPVLEKYRAIIKDYKVTVFEEAGTSFRLRAVIELVDGSELHVRETLIGGEKRKYAYQWQSGEGRLLVRWDNAPDWEVETFPHHKHVAEQSAVVASYERTLEQVLEFIAQRVESTA
jgi:hypothetical protein